MAYKQNFGPSRKSGKAVSMCGISRITNEAYGAEIGVYNITTAYVIP